MIKRLPGGLHAVAIAWLIALVAWASVPAPANAQLYDHPTSRVEPSYDQWQSVVDRVQRVLDDRDATEAQLQQMRANVAEYRTRFTEAQSINAAEIETVQRQLDVLGPPPGDGTSEPPEVAQRRDALNADLAQLRVPALRAQEAFVRADGLVNAIDTELREREARQVLNRFPLPFNPLNWQPVIVDVHEFVVGIPREILDRIDDADARGVVLSNLPQAIAALAAGLVLLARTGAWSGWLTLRINALQRRAVRRTMRILIVLAELALPLGGLALVLGALRLTGLAGTLGDALLLALAAFGASVIALSWLVYRLFPVLEDEVSPLRLAPGYQWRGRLLSLAIVLTLSLDLGLTVLNERVDLDNRTFAYLAFVLSLVTAVALLRIARMHRNSITTSFREDSERGFLDGVIGVLSTVAMLVIAVAVVAGLVGYVILAERTIHAAAWTFFLFGFLALVQRAVWHVYSVFRENSDRQQSEGLFPTLFGVVLVLGALPILALLWGARPTDLTEIWARIREGFSIGDVRLSPSEFLTFLLVFFIGFGLTRLSQKGLKNAILPKTKMDQGARTAIVSGLGYIGVFLAALAAITTAGIDLSSLAIFASALAVGIGFGLQTIVSNFVSGIILLIERPISEGDWIEVGGRMGYVRRIAVRATQIETFDRTDVIVPNADLVSEVVINWTRGNSIGRAIVPVGVARGSDSRLVERVLSEIAVAHPLAVISPPPQVLFMRITSEAMEFEVRAILRDVNYVLDVMSDINHEIVRRFMEEGIEIAFPPRDVWVRNMDGERGRSTGASAGHSTTPAPRPREFPGRAEDFGDAGGDGDGY